MPTPVNIARQHLSTPAATTLDDAVSIAKRRSHPQTTSLHALSSLLHQPSSLIQLAISRATTTSTSAVCSPRLQLRALQLCLTVALDRIPVSKPGPTEPPVSNSLMAAIKRSQANQRRHPDTFHLYNAENCLSVVKVEMKQFVLSILDDPLVSRVFADAGFRTCDVKLAILNPVVSRGVSSGVKCPPLFKCSLSDVEKDTLGSGLKFSVDFAVDENSRRIGEVLGRGERKNPLLVGGFAGEALKEFLECLGKKGSGVFTKEIEGLSVFSIDVTKFEFKEVSEMVESCVESGVVLNCGDFETFLDVETGVVSEMKRLLSSCKGKMWVIGFMRSDDVYKRLVERFPNIEMDFDLHLLPITSLTGTKRFKSSLMGSFVPLGGFFSLPSDLESTRTIVTQSSTLCNLCKKKYETEVSSITGRTPISSVPNTETVNLSSWLNITRGEASNKSGRMEAKDYSSVLDARVRAVQRKWNDICQRLHSSTINHEDVSESNSQMWSDPSSFVNRSNTAKSSQCTYPDTQKSYLPLQNYSKPVLLDDVADKVPSQVIDTNALHKPSPSQACTVAPSLTTDLGLGTFCASRLNESTSSQVADNTMYAKSIEYPWKVLAGKFYWQIDAIQSICQTVARCRNGKYPCSNNGNIWLTFRGPDKVSKMKIAAAVAELVLGGKEKLLCLDFRTEDTDCFNNSIFDCCGLNYERLKSGRKMIVDCLAEELSKRPNSVIILENIEKADSFVHSSLLRAIRTGKFPDSHGRDINVNNVIFVLIQDPPIGRVESEYPEEKILEAQNLQMQILVSSIYGNHNGAVNVLVIPSEIVSDKSSVNKRKSIDNDFGYAEASKRRRSMIDLNLPVLDTEEYSEDEEKCEDDISETMLAELLENVDENVVFKPFDFDGLAKKIVKEIDARLKKLAGVKISLEIDRQSMLQILAAAWVTDRNGALDDWIETVLCSTIKEAQQWPNVTSGIVMQLLPCVGLVVEEKAYGTWLPSRIHVN